MSLALLPVGARAQQLQPPVAPEDVRADEMPLTVPVTLNGQAGSMAFRAETPTESFLKGGIAFVGSYTDNALLTNSDKLDNFSYEVLPHITWLEITPRVSLNLGLNGGMIFNNNLSAQNQAAESVSLESAWRVTEHVTFTLTDAFSNTTGMFSLTGSQSEGTAVGAVEQSNNSLLVPPAQRTISNQSQAELRQQVGRNSVIGVRATLSLLDFPRSSKTAQFGTLYDSRAYSAEAFYNWKFASQQWFGLTARGQRFETLPSIATTDVGSLIMYYSAEPISSIMLTFFAGPEYSNTALRAGGAGLNGQGRFWGSSEGATLNWKASSSSASVSFVRQLNDGGGLASAANLQSVSANMRQQLSRHQNEIEFGFTTSKSDPLLVRESINGLSVFVLFQQRLMRSYVMQAGYSWQRQDLPLTRTPADANRTWFSVAYDFSRPLGK